jgi:phage terminase large subunit-like protein
LPLEVETWQYDFLDEAFSLTADGRRVYSEVVFGIPRKNGKSQIAAGLGYYLLTFDEESGPEIISAAGSKDQARVVHDVARKMPTKSPMLADCVRVMRDAIVCPRNDGTWKVVSHDADLQQGSNPSGAIVDEYHVHKTDALYNALAAGTGARQDPLLLTITTAGASLASPLGQLYQQALKLPEVEQVTPYLKVMRDRDAGFLMVWYGLDDEDADLEDPNVLKGCNPASWVSAEFLRKQLAKPSMRETHFRRFHLNQWVDGDADGIPRTVWEACKEGFEPLEPGQPVVVAVDASYRSDWSAVVAVGRTASGRITREIHAWAPPDGDDVELDLRATVDRTVTSLMSKYSVRKIVADKFLIRTMMQEWQSRGWPVDDFPMWDSTMCPASAAFLESVQSGEYTHDGARDETEHVLAMVMRDTQRAWRFDKHKKTAAKIDIGIALVMGVYTLRTMKQAAYADRGLIVL